MTRQDVSEIMLLAKRMANTQAKARHQRSAGLIGRKEARSMMGVAEDRLRRKIESMIQEFGGAHE